MFLEVFNLLLLLGIVLQVLIFKLLELHLFLLIYSLVLSWTIMLIKDILVFIMEIFIELISSLFSNILMPLLPYALTSHVKVLLR